MILHPRPFPPSSNASGLATLTPADAAELPSRKALMRMARYALALEAHATCTPQCARWQTCPGMRLPEAGAGRGSQLERTLDAELRLLEDRHPAGFAVRLHRLGDFYDLQYLRRWAAWLEALPGLHVYGATAWPPESDIGDGVLTMRIAFPSRWWVRFARSTAPCSASSAAGLRLIRQRPSEPVRPSAPPLVDAADLAAGAIMAQALRSTGIFDQGPHEPRGCRFILGDPSAGAWHFCQEGRTGESAYCTVHHALTRRHRPTIAAAS